MNSRIKRRNKCWTGEKKLGTGKTTDFNEKHKIAIGGYGNYKDYRYTYYDLVLKNMIHHLKKMVMPYSINKKRFGTKSWWKLVNLQKAHQWG